MTKSGEILSVSINHGVNAESQLYRLKRGTNLHIVPGGSLLGRRVALYCNFPVNGKTRVWWRNKIQFHIEKKLFSDKADFIRRQYIHMNWFRPDGKKITDEDQPYAEITNLDIYCELQLNRAGTFHFYFTYDQDGFVFFFHSPNNKAKIFIILKF